MANGVNKIDTMMGYAGNINGEPRGAPAVPDPDPTVVTQDEFLTVPGSLLRKAQTAQSVFDNRFLLPFAPERPEFFLVPGNNQVTVLWAPSPTEDPANPDPFFAVASDVSQPLYDPNFRANDVEGYRIYRGRVDNPSELGAPSPVRLGAGCGDRQGHLQRLPRAAEPDAAVRAGAQRLHRLRSGSAAAAPAGYAVHRLPGDRPGGDDHPGDPGQPGGSWRAARPSFSRARSTPRSPMCPRVGSVRV